MRSVPYVLSLADEDSLPGISDLDNQMAYCVERPGGSPRIDLPRIRAVARTDAVEWLWPNRIAIGQVTLIEAGSGGGQVVRGPRSGGLHQSRAPWPRHAAGRRARFDRRWPGGRPAALLAGRLVTPPSGVDCRGLGADLKSVRHFEDFQTFEPDSNREVDRPIAFPFDLPAIANELEFHPEIGLIVIDPLSDYCDGPQHLAETLRQLNRLAQAWRVAIVVTLPANCRFDVQGVLRVSSRWQTDAARCVWTVVADPHDPGRRLFTLRRMNFCEEPRGLAFRLTGGQVVWDPGPVIDPADPLGQRAAIESCLGEVMRSGSVPAKDVFRLGGQCGFNPGQLRVVGKKMGIESRKGEGYGEDGGWVWHPPARECRLRPTSRESQSFPDMGVQPREPAGRNSEYRAHPSRRGNSPGARKESRVSRWRYARLRCRWRPPIATSPAKHNRRARKTRNHWKIVGKSGIRSGPTWPATPTAARSTHRNTRTASQAGSRP